MTNDSHSLTRRAAIRNAVLLLGGAATAAQLGALESVFAQDAVDSKPRFLDDDQLALLERVVDLIIPETDTPGAVSAGVHRFIDVMLAGWASSATREQFVGGFESIDRRAAASGMPDFCFNASRRARY